MAVPSGHDGTPDTRGVLMGGPSQLAGHTRVDVGRVDPHRLLRQGEDRHVDNRREQWDAIQLGHGDHCGVRAGAQHDEAGAAIYLPAKQVTSNLCSGEGRVDDRHRHLSVAVRRQVLHGTDSGVTRRAVIVSARMPSRSVSTPSTSPGAMLPRLTSGPNSRISHAC